MLEKPTEQSFLTLNNIPNDLTLDNNLPLPVLTNNINKGPSDEQILTELKLHKTSLPETFKEKYYQRKKAIDDPNL